MTFASFFVILPCCLFSCGAPFFFLLMLGVSYDGPFPTFFFDVLFFAFVPPRPSLSKSQFPFAHNARVFPS